MSRHARFRFMRQHGGPGWPRGQDLQPPAQQDAERYRHDEPRREEPEGQIHRGFVATGTLWTMICTIATLDRPG
jgi:hypothetical protein